VPGNILLAEVIVFSEIKNFLFDFQRDSNFGILRARLGIDQAFFPMRQILPLPAMIGVAGDTKVTASIGNTAALFRSGKDF